MPGPVLSEPIKKQLSYATRQLVEALEQAIKRYDSDGTLENLQQVLARKQKLDEGSNEQLLADNLAYRQWIQADLFQWLKSEFATQGYDSLYKPGAPATSTVSSEDRFAALLTNMSPDKANRLLELMEDKGESIQQISDLYGHETSAEAEAYRAFFDEHSISYLGGGNSKNFLISSANSTGFVLKADNRMGNDNKVVDGLRNSDMNECLVPVQVSRLVVCTKIKPPASAGAEQGTEEVVTRRLQTTQYCTGGDLLSHSLTCANEEDRTRSAMAVYGQMLTVLSKFSEKNIFFPDMKNSNWLMGADKQLILADTKSLMACHSSGLIDLRFQPFGHSVFMDPPEFNADTRLGQTPGIVDTQAAQSFMFAKNLYQYLTKCDNTQLFGVPYSQNISFEHKVFYTSEGKALKQLIEDMLELHPEKRPSMQDVQARFAQINALGITKQADIEAITLSATPSEPLKSIPQQQDELRVLMFNICQLYALNNDSSDDAGLEQFQQTTVAEINKFGSDLPGIKAGLKVMEQKGLELRSVKTAVEDTINELRKKDGFFSIGVKKKIDNIETAWKAIPVTERHRVFDPTYEPGIALQKAIAAHRHFPGLRTVKVDNGEIVERSAAKSFGYFKQRVNTLKAEEATKAAPDAEPEPGLTRPK